MIESVWDGVQNSTVRICDRIRIFRKLLIVSYLIVDLCI